MNDPFNPNDRMYKTGDLGRWLPNGENPKVSWKRGSSGENQRVSD